jgi:uncharacterized membrane protein
MPSATIMPNSWTAGAAQSTWRFGHPWVGADQRDGMRWVLRRNCSVTPRQMLGFYLSMCVVSLGIASGFALHGAPVVLVFAGVELLVLGLALLVYARHATDADTLTLSGQNLAVEQTAAGVTRTTHFRAEWVTVEPSRQDGSLVELSGQGQQVQVGRFLRPEMRGVLARELRLALRHALHRPVSSQAV